MFVGKESTVSKSIVGFEVLLVVSVFFVSQCSFSLLLVCGEENFPANISLCGVICALASM